MEDYVVLTELVSKPTLKNGLTSFYINCLTEDKNGNIWFGTQEETLFAHRRK
jgi:hypothetical protein